MNEIVLHINTLVEKLNVHLCMEDQFLYPHLKTSENKTLHDKTEAYMNEMASLHNHFNSYKVKYNMTKRLEEAE